MDPIQFKKEKAFAMADAVIGAATEIASISKLLPKSKLRKNVFLKSYNRRPGNKKKTAIALAKVYMAARLTRLQLLQIISQPNPRFNPGSSCAAIIERAPEYIDRNFAAEVMHFKNGTQTLSLQTGKPFTGFEEF